MSLTAEYVSWVFAASCGVLQVAVAYSRLRGLCFFERPLWGYVFGSLVAAASFGWFFGTSDRNAVGFPYQTPQQTQVGYVAVALLLALLFTLIVSSVAKGRRLSRSIDAGKGLESLGQATYFQVIRHLFRKRRTE